MAITDENDGISSGSHLKILFSFIKSATKELQNICVLFVYVRFCYHSFLPNLFVQWI